MIKMSFLFIFYHFFQNFILNMNMKKEVIRLFLLHELHLGHIKQRPILTEHLVKDSLMIGQYDNGFGISFVEIHILKIKKEEMHVQLSKM